MRKFLIVTLIFALPLALSAQGTVSDLETDTGARLSVGLDKKLSKGFHVQLEEELRLKDHFGTVGRSQTTLGLSYKVNKMFKMGAGYIFIDRQNSAGEWKLRHRFYVDGRVLFRFGDWRLSVKERLQLTHRDVGNAYQSNPNSLALKSRLKVSYNRWTSWTPYAYFELRNVFNDPSCKATWSTVSEAYSNYSFGGYDDAYINRLRGCLGAEWKINKQHGLDFSLLGDYNYDKEIDTNKEGTKLKALTWERKLRFNLCVGYRFSF